MPHTAEVLCARARNERVIVHPSSDDFLIVTLTLFTLFHTLFAEMVGQCLDSNFAQEKGDSILVLKLSELSIKLSVLSEHLQLLQEFSKHVKLL